MFCTTTSGSRFASPPLSRCRSCSPTVAGVASRKKCSAAEKARQKPRPRIEQEARYDTCGGCCNKTVLNALAKTAYHRLDNGCCFEPSLRVREAAVNAINVCGIPCRDWWWGYTEECETDEEPTTDDTTEDPKKEEEPKGEETPMQPGEETPEKKDEGTTPVNSEGPGFDRASDGYLSPVPRLAPQLVPLTTTSAASHSSAAHFSELTALSGYCPVGLKAKQFYKAVPEYSSVYNNRLYTFWSEAAKKEFDRIPEAYAMTYAGFDPVELARTGQQVEGKYLRVYADRFFLFASKENWDEFKSNPASYYSQEQVELVNGTASSEQ